MACSAWAAAKVCGLWRGLHAVVMADPVSGRVAAATQAGEEVGGRHSSLRAIRHLETRQSRQDLLVAPRPGDSGGSRLSGAMRCGPAGGKGSLERQAGPSDPLAVFGARWGPAGGSQKPGATPDIRAANRWPTAVSIVLLESPDSRSASCTVGGSTPVHSWRPRTRSNAVQWSGIVPQG